MHDHELVMPTEPGGRLTCSGCDETFPCPHAVRLPVSVLAKDAPVPPGLYLVCRTCGDYEVNDCEHERLTPKLGPTHLCMDCGADVPVHVDPPVRNFIGSHR